MARTQQGPPKGVELSRLLTVRGRKGAHEWLTTVLGVPVTLNYVRDAATKNKTLPSTRVGGALMFSTQDLFDWAMSLSERTDQC